MINLVLKKTAIFNAPVSKVWTAITTSEWLEKYFPNTKVISEWKAGTPIIFTGNWQGKDFTDKGTILKFEPNKIFQYNYWSGFSGLPDIPENYMPITFELEEKENETHLTLTQENFANDTQYKHSDSGWSAILNTMKELLEK